MATQAKLPTKTDGYIVIIEWDGNIPPTPYYHRLRGMTSGVRGDKEQNVIERRASNIPDDAMGGLILQEGAIITPSYSLAGAIAALAKRYGAPMVHIGEVSLNNYTEMTDADRTAMERVNEAYGKRGRPQKSINWMVTCFEDMRSMFVEDLPFVPACPKCGGFSVTAVPAKNPVVYKYIVESGGERSLINEWEVTRFGSGLFMLPLPKDYTRPVIKGDEYWAATPAKEIRKNINTVSINNSKQAYVVDAMMASDLVIRMDSAVRSDPSMSDTALDILDGIFVSQVYFTEVQRDEHRIKSIMSIMADGYNEYIGMSSNDSDFDVLDASCAFEPEYMKGAFHMLANV